MNLFQILDVVCDGDIAILVNAIRSVFTLIQWGIPLVLIVMGTIDMFKAMASGDEKKTKESKDKFIRRLIYAVVAFLIPFIISLTFTVVGGVLSDESADDGKTTYDNFFSCWKDADKNVQVSSGKCVDSNGTTVSLSKSNCNGSYHWVD